MPTYEYECTVCGHQFERMQAMSAKPLSKCPECGKKVKRLITGAAVIVKGGSSELACGRDAPCCGADAPCQNRPCDA